MQIAMEGRESAEQWKKDAQALNDRTESLLNDVSELLKSVKDFSDGTLVDEIFDLGTNLVNATRTLMEGMNQIFNVVNGLLDFLQQLFTGASANTRNVSNTIC